MSEMRSEPTVTIDGKEVPKESRVTIREPESDPEALGTLELPQARIDTLTRRAEALGITAGDLAEQIFQHADQDVRALSLTRITGQLAQPGS
jgi:hypothetical protein